MQIFFYSTCHAWGEIPQLCMKTWLKGIFRGMLEDSTHRYPSYKNPLQTHRFRHKEPRHKFNWHQLAKVPLALFLRVHHWRQLQTAAPSGSIQYQTSHYHLSARTGNASFSCRVSKRSHLNYSPVNGDETIHLANLLLLNDRKTLPEIPRVSLLFSSAMSTES